MRLDLSALAASDVLQPPGKTREGVAQRDVYILVVIAIDDELVARNVNRDADVEPATLLLVPVLLLDDDVATDDSPVELLQFGSVFADARVERHRMRHVPKSDLQWYLHASVSS